MTAIRLSGTLVLLTTLWVLLWDDLSVANVLSGLLVGVAVLGLARVPSVVRRDRGDVARIDPLRTVWFGLFVLYKLVQANLVLAWEIVTPRNRIHTGVLAVPLRTDSDLVMLTVATVITLTPGTVTLEALGSPPVLYVHVLHLDDVERIRRDLLHIEEVAVRAFGSASARAQLRAGGAGGQLAPDGRTP